MPAFSPFPPSLHLVFYYWDRGHVLLQGHLDMYTPELCRRFLTHPHRPRPTPWGLSPASWMECGQAGPLPLTSRWGGAAPGDCRAGAGIVGREQSPIFVFANFLQDDSLLVEHISLWEGHSSSQQPSPFISFLCHGHRARGCTCFWPGALCHAWFPLTYPYLCNQSFLKNSITQYGWNIYFLLRACCCG